MDMHIDQTWHQRLAGGIDDFRVQRFGIPRGRSKNLRDLAVPNQNGTVIDHGAVSNKYACVLNQS